MEKQKKAADVKPVEYFERPNIIWYLLIVPGITYVALLAYAPSFIPFSYLGPIGKFTHYLHTNHEIIPILLFWATFGAHMLEAVYAVRKADQLKISVFNRNRWFFQTLLLGYPSLRLILGYARQQEKLSKYY